MDAKKTSPASDSGFVRILINGKPYTADSKMTGLEVLRANNYDIPTLCYHPALTPSSSCGLCSVEIKSKSTGQPAVALSCILPLREGLEIRTNSVAVHEAREKAFASLVQMAPQSAKIRKLAADYGIELGAPPDGCIRCHLCIKVCKEIVGPGALRMENINGVRWVVPVPDACIGCGTCANICPTRVIRIEDSENVRTISIRDDIIGRHPLEICEGCGQRFATPKFLDHIAHRVATHADVKERHNYCPTCAKLFSDRIKPLRKKRP
jgi:predicted molibdopterin-dependent oxidoreductase YjgC